MQVPPLPMIPTDPMDIAVAIAVVVGAVGCVGVAAMLVRAVIRKWLHPLPAPDVSGALADLRHVVGQLSGEITELQERVDFAERMLAQGSDRQRVEGGH